MQCERCGSHLNDGDKFCMVCGAEVDTKQSSDDKQCGADMSITNKKRKFKIVGISSFVVANIFAILVVFGRSIAILFFLMSDLAYFISIVISTIEVVRAKHYGYKANASIVLLLVNIIMVIATFYIITLLIYHSHS